MYWYYHLFPHQVHDFIILCVFSKVKITRTSCADAEGFLILVNVCVVIAFEGSQ